MRSTYRFWMISLTSPLIYLVICLLVDRYVFVRYPIPGFSPLSAPVYSWLFGALALLAFISLPVVFFLKRQWAVKAREAVDEDAAILESPRGRRFAILLIICDTVALIGLILFLIQGSLTAMLFFGIAGLLNYAAAFPGQPADSTDEG
jgi:hypothetical protein